MTGLLSINDHVIVCGYGSTGQIVARDLREEGVTVVVVDRAAETVSKAEDDGHLALAGDVLDPEVLDAGLSALTRRQLPPRAPAAYELLAGIAGDRPLVYRASNRPFTERFALAGEPLTVRMDSWLPTDTFRRGGFGHVVRGHSHVLAIERGVSLVWFGRDGEPSRPYYAASLFASEPRYRIPAATLELAGMRHSGHVPGLLSRMARWLEP